jgi:hypothetical protein
MLCLLLADCAASPVSSDAVWQPPDGFMRRFHARCDGRAGKAFTDCFVDAMADAGARPAALAFARRLGGDGYLRAFDDAGPVGIAYVVIPFRANENDMWLLVNGRPPLIDVDDQRLLDLAALQAAPAYRALLRRFPRAALWPDERGGPPGPAVRTLASSGRMVVVSYRLRDFCHACAVIGRVRFGFVFDQVGDFKGTRLVSVAPVAPLKTRSPG